jgi:hypothetical protein
MNESNGHAPAKGWEVKDGELFESGEAVPVRPCVVRAVLRGAGQDERAHGPILGGLVRKILRIERYLSIRQLAEALRARA